MTKKNEFHINREKLEKNSLKLLILFGVILLFFHFLERYPVDIENLKVVIGVPENYFKSLTPDTQKITLPVRKIGNQAPNKSDVFVFDFENDDFEKLEKFLISFPDSKVFFLGKPPSIDTKKFIETLDKNRIIIGIVEFDDSTGFMNWVAQKRERKDLVFRVHRIKDKEFESLNLDLKMTLNRWKRAVLERSIDLLFVTLPPESFNITYPEYIKLVKNEIQKYIGTELHLTHYNGLRISLYIAIICGFLLFLSYSPLFTLIYILVLLVNISTNSNFTFLASYVGILGPVALFAVVNRKINEPFKKLFYYAFFAILTGYIVNSLLSETVFLNQVLLFRGVKLSLTTLPGLVFLKEILNPENQIIKSKINSLDIFVAIVVGAGALYYILRSGNTPLALNFERKFRDLLENIFFTRPRFKELIGYPFLLIHAFNYQKFLKRYSFFVPVLGSIGIVSTVNTFCHIRAPLFLSSLRSLLGILFGYLFGLIFYHLMKKFLTKRKRVRSKFSPRKVVYH
jgi:hypothetical protein